MINFILPMKGYSHLTIIERKNIAKLRAQKLSKIEEKLDKANMCGEIGHCESDQVVSQEKIKAVQLFLTDTVAILF